MWIDIVWHRCQQSSHRPYKLLLKFSWAYTKGRSVGWILVRFIRKNLLKWRNFECTSLDVSHISNLLLSKTPQGVLPISTKGPSAVFRRRGSFYHNVSGSNISKTVWPRNTKFYRHIRTDLLYSRTGYDVTSYFRSDVVAKKPSRLNSSSDGFGWNFSRKLYTRSTKFYKFIGGDRPYKSAGYDITSCFQLDAKCNQILHKSA